MSIQEIQAERAAQQAKFDNDNWSASEWAALVTHYATRRAVGDLHAIDMAAFRADIVKVGALVLACIEAIDRKGQ